MKIFNRRLDITLLCSLLSTVLAQSAYAECKKSVPAFVEKITQQVIMVGEIHGTHEMPAFAGDLLCYYAKKKTPVLIGFAMPLNSQASINAYVVSKGDKTDQDALFSDPFWRESARFGLASKAIWEVLELARRLKNQGYLVVPFAYDQQRLRYDAVSPPAKIGKPLSPNAHIGWNLVSRGLAYPEYKIIVLSGNANADRDAGYENAIAIVERFIPVFSIGFVHVRHEVAC